MANRLFKDRRVGGDAAETIFIDQLLQTTGLQKTTLDEIEPYTLTGGGKRFERIGHDGFLCAASSARARPQT